MSSYIAFMFIKSLLDPMLGKYSLYFVFCLWLFKLVLWSLLPQRMVCILHIKVNIILDTTGTVQYPGQYEIHIFF